MSRHWPACDNVGVRNAVATTALALLTACGSSGVRSPFTLRVATVGPLEPIGTGLMQGYSSLAQEWVYEQLIRVNEDGTLAPALAERLERRGGGLHFVIRPGVKFSDGSPVRPSDVIESLTRYGLTGKEDADGIFVEPIRGSIDSTLPFVVVSSNHPGSAPLGSGPFRIVASSPTRIVLERVKPVAHRIDRVELLGFATPRETIARTLAGDAELLPRLEPRLAEFFDGVRRVRVLKGQSTQAASVAFSMKLGLGERRALAALLAKAGLGEAAFGSACPAWHRETASAPPLPPGPRLDVVSPRIDVGYERLSLAVRRALGRRGGRIIPMSIKEAVGAWTSGQFHILTAPSLIWPPFAAGALFGTDSAENPWHYSDPNVDRALAASDWGAMRRALEENPPLVLICVQQKLIAVDARIKNPRLGPFALLEFVPEWEVE